MKLIIFLVTLIPSVLFGQTNKSDTIYVGLTKTVVLIFPDTIVEESVDLGLPKDWLDSRVVGRKFYIFAKKDFRPKESSLIIEGKRGYVYSFVLKFTPNPTKLIIPISYNQSSFHMGEQVELGKILDNNPTESGASINASSNENKSISETSVPKQKEEVPSKSSPVSNGLKGNCESIMDKSFSIYGCGKSEGKMTFVLVSIYIIHGKLYFKVLLKNQSNLKFDINYMNFVLEDAPGVTKSTSEQMKELKPIYVYNDQYKSVEGKSQLIRIYVFDKFTIDSDENLVISAGENEGRRLSFSVPAKEVLNARSQ